MPKYYPAPREQGGDGATIVAEGAEDVSLRRRWRSSRSRSSTKSAPPPTSSPSSRTTSRCARRAPATRGCVRFTARSRRPSPSTAIAGSSTASAAAPAATSSSSSSCRRRSASPTPCEQLAQRFGVPIPELEASEDGRESAAEREALLRAHEVAAAYFREQLDRPAARADSPVSRSATRGLHARNDRRRSASATRRRRAKACASGSLKTGLSPALVVASGLVSGETTGRRSIAFATG